MAADGVRRVFDSVSVSVTSTAADTTVALGDGAAQSFAVHHVTGVDPVYFRYDGTAADATAPTDCLVILPGASREVDIEGSTGNLVFSFDAAGDNTVHLEVFH